MEKDQADEIINLLKKIEINTRPIEFTTLGVCRDNTKEETIVQDKCVMKNGVHVEFKPDGIEVSIVGKGIDVLKALELVCTSLDESLGSTVLADDILDRIIAKRKQAKEQSSKPDTKEQKVSEMFGLIMMMEAFKDMKANRFMQDFENKTGHSVKPRSSNERVI